MENIYDFSAVSDNQLLKDYKDAKRNKEFEKADMIRLELKKQKLV